MKLIIAGSRHFNFYVGKHMIDTSFIDTCLNILRIKFPKEVVCGCGGVNKAKVEKLVKDRLLVSDKGIDRLGEFWADSYWEDVKIVRFPADWEKHGKAAGPIRNREMANYADALLLIWDGKSRGSKNMKEEMEKLGKPVYEVILKGMQ